MRDENNVKTQRLLIHSAKCVRFKIIIENGTDDIEKTFIDVHKDIFKYKMENGLWLWKPYLIKKTLEKVDDGNIVFYCDSGASLFKSPKAVYVIVLSEHKNKTT